MKVEESEERKKNIKWIIGDNLYDFGKGKFFIFFLSLIIRLEIINKKIDMIKENVKFLYVKKFYEN